MLSGSGSSSTSGGLNREGAHCVKCWQCTRTICYSVAPITRALCGLCQASADGILLSEDAIRDYVNASHGSGEISLLTLHDDPTEAPVETQTRFASTFGRALGFLRERVQSIATPSKALAKTKRRGRLLEGLELGSMTELDARLKDKGGV